MYGDPVFGELNDALPSQTSSSSKHEDNLQFDPEGRINILKMKLNGVHPSDIILEELKSHKAKSIQKLRGIKYKSTPVVFFSIPLNKFVTFFHFFYLFFPIPHFFFKDKNLKMLLDGNKKSYRYNVCNNNNNERREELSVEAQVECLIDLATDPNICIRSWQGLTLHM
jgi:hypothetical protein